MNNCEINKHKVQQKYNFKIFVDDYLGSLDVEQISVDYKQDLLENAVMGEECYRPCKANNRKICYFHWTMENYQAMGG